MSATVAAIEAIGIVPVVVIDDAARAADLAHALIAGGIGCAEFTLRTAAGLEAITSAAGVPGFLAGAGTVLSSAQADAVVGAGAAFVVSPGFDAEVSHRVADRGATMVPGVATPTEVQRAAREGFTHLKLFPAGLLGGPEYLDALAGPFADVRLLPSGGVTPATLAAYLARPTVFAASGSWMVPRAAIAAGDFDLVAALCRDAVTARDAARGAAR